MHAHNFSCMQQGLASCRQIAPVDPKVSMAKYSPSSMRVASPPFTIGTLLPAWMRYGAMLCPLRLRTHLTCTYSSLYIAFQSQKIHDKHSPISARQAAKYMHAQ